MKLSRLIQLAIKQKKRSPSQFAGKSKETFYVAPMEGDLMKDLATLPPLLEDEMPEVEKATLQQLIRSNKKVVINNKPLDLLHN
jgi:hypothetical protein